MAALMSSGFCIARSAASSRLLQPLNQVADGRHFGGRGDLFLAAIEAFAQPGEVADFHISGPERCGQVARRYSQPVQTREAGGDPEHDVADEAEAEQHGGGHDERQRDELRCGLPLGEEG